MKLTKFVALALLSFSPILLSNQPPVLTPIVPPENIGSGIKAPTDKVEELARRIVETISSANTSDASNLIFPPEPFLMLKAIPRAGDYHSKLVLWASNDIKLEQARLRLLGPLKFVRLQLGRSRWVRIGAESNNIAYWSLKNSTIYVAGDSQKSEKIVVNSIINWGKDWYVTHLGPVPKNTAY